MPDGRNSFALPGNVVCMNESVIKYAGGDIQNLIYTIRGCPVMIDRDLAVMYQVETKVLNQAVRRNLGRFPDHFRFQLTEKERDKLVTNCDRFEMLKHSSVLPYAFTEQGVAMLSAVLRSPVAVQVSIRIMDAFVELRQTAAAQSQLTDRVSRLELKQTAHEQAFEKLFSELDKRQLKDRQGIFFDGQTFDAYSFVSDIIRSADKSIELIDNYIDDSVLLLLTKRKPGVAATIYTRRIPATLLQDLERHNQQYEPIEIRQFDKAHDRFLIIDGQKVYHIGASLKDLGRKWFAFSVIDQGDLTLLERLQAV